VIRRDLYNILNTKASVALSPKGDKATDAFVH